MFSEMTGKSFKDNCLIFSKRSTVFDGDFLFLDKV